MMKQFIGAAAALAVLVAADPSAQCMYCRNEDRAAGFLTTFSFCAHQDLCLQDEWNYIKRECQDDWVRGATYGLEKCEPETIECPGFKSTTEYYQRYKNQTWAMAEGSKCKITVDASEAIARVIFSSSSYLGINYNAQMDEVITIASGKLEIEIYNAAESGPITFGLSFSGAQAILTSALTATAAAITVLSF